MTKAFADWSLQLGQLGSVVEDVEDVHQAIRIILGTPAGSDPHNPEFGSSLWKYLDLPVPEAAPQIIREAAAALRRWEPRVKLSGISLQATKIGALTLRVKWTAQDQAGQTSVDLARSENGAA